MVAASMVERMDPVHFRTPEITMNTDTRTPWRDTLETTAGQLVERVSERAFAATSGAEPSRLWRWVLAAIGLFLAWKMLRGLKTVF